MTTLVQMTLAAVAVSTMACAPNYDDFAKGLDASRGIQMARAHFCAAHGATEIKQADTHSVLDGWLLVSALLLTTGGTTTSAVSAFISDTKDGGQPSDARQWVAGTGAGLAALGAGLLLLRTALGFSERAHAERIASAHRIDLASQLAGESDEQKSRQLFQQCANQDLQVADALLGIGQGGTPTGSGSTPPVVGGGGAPPQSPPK